MRRLAILSAALLLAGCSQAVVDDSGGLQVDFAAQAASSSGYFEVPVVSVTGGEGEILVEGLVAAPSPCQQLRASADGAAPRIELTVRIEPVGEACVASIGNFTYTARVRNLAPGAYTLRLRHDYPGTGWDAPTRDVEVTVR